MRIIDFHNHIFPSKVASKVTRQLGSYYNYPIHGTGEVENLVKLSKEAGMYKVLVHSTATKLNQVETINDYLAEQVKEQEGYFIGFGTMHQDFENVKAELERMKSMGLCGIKLHPDFQGFNIDDDRIQRVYELAEDMGMPILMHVGDVNSDMSSPKRMGAMVHKFPEATFIAAHFGGYSRWNEAMEYLCGEDLYFDTSSSLDKLSDDEAMEIISLHGADKMLYASDYPIVTHRECLERFSTLPLNEEQKELIYYKNASRLLGID